MKITIDHILDKYRSICRYDSEAEREASVERFRGDLLDQPYQEQIATYLALFGSHDRAWPMLVAMADEEPEIFWPTILSTWDICDGLWPLRRDFLHLLRKNAARRIAREFLDDADRAFLDELPEIITVFRGCARHKVRGLPWTTDRKVAGFFSRGGRFSQPHDAVIAEATIAKREVFFVATGRQESELVLDPYAISRPRLTAAPPGFTWTCD